VSRGSPAIELRHLRYFLAVFEELHFGRAAQRLHIAQPPLSQAIRKLEGELGVRLFDRTSRAVSPTPAGNVLAEEARKTLASFEFAVTETRQVDDGELPLRIGCLLHLPSSRLERLLTELKKHDGELRTDVAHLLVRTQVEALRSGRLDLGVLWHSEDFRDLEYAPLFPSGELRAFVPAGHPLADEAVLTPESLASETLIVFPREANPVFYDRLLAMLEEAGYRFQGLREASTDPRDLILAVEGGLGITLTPATLIEIAEGRGVVHRPLDPQLQLPDVIVAWRADPPRRIRALLPAIRESANGLYQGAAAT
jgi:DNA-binding transcriptional LysR family regulator